MKQMNKEEISVISLPDKSSPTESKERNKIIRKNSEENDVSYWNVSYIFVILVFCTFFASPVSLIPRSNSIFYQSRWFEFNFVYGIYALLPAGTDLLNLTTYFNDKSLQSFGIFLRLYLLWMTLWSVPYLCAYAIWCEFFGFNWPIPYLGYNFLIVLIMLPIG